MLSVTLRGNLKTEAASTYAHFWGHFLWPTFCARKFSFCGSSEIFQFLLLLLLLFTITITKSNKQESTTKWKLCVSKSQFSKCVVKTKKSLTVWQPDPAQRFAYPPSPLCYCYCPEEKKNLRFCKHRKWKVRKRRSRRILRPFLASLRS